MVLYDLKAKNQVGKIYDTLLSKIQAEILTILRSYGAAGPDPAVDLASIIAKMGNLRYALNSPFRDTSLEILKTIREDRDLQVAASLKEATGEMVQEVMAVNGGTQASVTASLNRFPKEEIISLSQNLDQVIPSKIAGGLNDVVWNNVSNELIAGMTMGENPMKVAKRMMDQFGMNKTSAETLAQTTILGAHRTAKVESYRANDHVVAKWIWNAHLDDRTCALCWAMDGTEHPLTEDMISHARCRCAPRPKTKTWEELGFVGIPELTVNKPTGAEKFTQLDEEHKRNVLGPSRYALYKSGNSELSDFVGGTVPTVYGQQRTLKTLKSMGYGLEEKKDLQERAKSLTSRKDPTKLSHDDDYAARILNANKKYESGEVGPERYKELVRYAGRDRKSLISSDLRAPVAGNIARPITGPDIDAKMTELERRYRRGEIAESTFKTQMYKMKKARSQVEGTDPIPPVPIPPAPVKPSQGVTTTTPQEIKKPITGTPKTPKDADAKISDLERRHKAGEISDATLRTQKYKLGKLKKDLEKGNPPIDPGPAPKPLSPVPEKGITPVKSKNPYSDLTEAQLVNMEHVSRKDRDRGFITEEEYQQVKRDVQDAAIGKAIKTKVPPEPTIPMPDIFGSKAFTSKTAAQTISPADSFVASQRVTSKGISDQLVKDVSQIHDIPIHIDNVQVAEGDAKFFQQQGMPRNTQGLYSSGTRKIYVQPGRNETSSRDTAVHEFGHHLDWQLGNKATMEPFSESNAPSAQRFRELMESTSTNKALKTVSSKSGSNQVWATYANAPREYWARSYAQYVADNGTDSEAFQFNIKTLAQGATPSTWDGKDRDKAYEAVETVLVDQGLLPVEKAKYLGRVK